MNGADDDANLHPGVCRQAPQTIGGGFPQRLAMAQPDVRTGLKTPGMQQG